MGLFASVVARWAFGQTMTAFGKMLFPDDLPARLLRAAGKWKDGLPPEAELLTIDTLFADKLPALSGQAPPEPVEVTSKLKIQQVPTGSDWLAALLRQWEWIRDIQATPQNFFKIDRDRAEVHLRDLAERLTRECQTTSALFQVQTLTDLSVIRSEITEIKSLLRTEEVHGQESDGNHHGEIDTARDFVKEGKPDVTIAQLEALQSRHSLTNRELYRVHANLGHAYQAQDEKEKAAKSFIKAAQYQRNDENARALEAAGYYMLSDNARALQVANEVLAQFPSADLASSMRIRCEPDSKSFEDIESTASEPLKLLPETQLSLSLRALQSDKYEKAERYARLAFEPDKSSAVVSEHLAIVLLNRARKANLQELGMPPQSGAMKETVVEAQSLLAMALSKTPAGAKLSTGRIRFYQGVAAYLLDDVFSAESHFRAALDSDPKHPEYIRHLAIVSFDLERKHDAIRLLKEGLENDKTGMLGMMLASCLLQRKTAGDLAAAIDVLEQGISHVADFAPHVREGYVAILCQALGASKRHDDAAALLDKQGEHLTKPSLHTLRASQLRRAGKAEEAAAEIRQALQYVPELTDPVAKRMVAEELTTQRLWLDALPIWKELVKPNGFGPYSAGLMQCAWNADDDGFILDFCAQLRGNGIYDPDSFHLELNILWKYNGTTAVVDAIQGYLAAPKDESLAKELRLRLSHLAIVLGRKDLECFDLYQIPSADDARPDLGLMAVMLLVHSPQSFDAVKYAYALVRRNFSSSAAHKAMILSVLWRQKNLELPKSKVVAPEFAVRYKDNDSEDEHWHVIEDLDSPDSGRNEFSPTHALSIAMMGKSANDTFVIRKDQVQEKTGTILEIWSKYQFRAARCLEEWETRFHDERWLWKFTSKNNDDPKEALAPAFKAIDTQTAFFEERENEYRTSPVASPTIFAAMVGVSVLEIVQHLATKEELPIRCWLGSKVENSKAAEAVKTAGALVIESTALSTLFVTGLSKELSGLQSRLIVPRGAFLDLRQRLLELKNAGNRYLTKQGDKYVFIEESNELVSQRIAALEEFISTIESRCEIEDGTALAHMPVVERTRLIQSAGREAAEAIALAQNRGCPIWADDLLVAAAADLFGVQRVWTDFLLQMPDSPWRFSAKSRHHYVAKLAYCGFQFTRLSPQSLLETCQDAKWNLEDARLRLVLKWFSTPELVGELVTAVAWQSLPKIWDKAPNRARAYELTCHLLRNICQRGDAKRILNTLHKQAESVRDADTARAIKTAIEIWR